MMFFFLLHIICPKTWPCISVFRFIFIYIYIYKHASTCHLQTLFVTQAHRSRPIGASAASRIRSLNTHDSWHLNQKMPAAFHEELVNNFSQTSGKPDTGFACNLITHSSWYWTIHCWSFITFSTSAHAPGSLSWIQVVFCLWLQEMLQKTACFSVIVKYIASYFFVWQDPKKTVDSWSDTAATWDVTKSC